MPERKKSAPRKKSALITRVPLMSLSREDFEKVKYTDPRYIQLLNKSDEKSYSKIRKEIKPYVFTLLAGTQVTFMCNTKVEAMKQLAEKYGTPTITKITVDLENGTKELVTPEEQKAARKAKRNQV